LNLAPSADVNSADDNPVIGTRSFGPDTDLVARHAAAAVTGLQTARVAACAKHFPGHGSTSSDSHHEIATVQGGLAELRRRDLPPFAAAIAAGVRAVMPGHLRVAGLTGGLPATWSAAAITGVLRGELGFTGVVITDALEMRAVSDPHGVPEAAVAAVAAGCDLLCFGRDQDAEMYLAVRDAITRSIADGRLPAERVAEAAGRVAGLRSWLARQRSGAVAAAGDGARGWHDTEAGLAAARRALRVTGLSRPLADPVVVELRPLDNIAVGSVPWGLEPWLDGSVYRIDTAAGHADQSAVIGDVLARAAGRPLVVVVRDAHRHPAARAAATALLTARPDAVVVEMGLPVWRPPSGGYVATYGAARPNGQAAAEALGLAAAQPA
jgi:beta-N-acetylhexosaminidase